MIAAKNERLDFIDFYKGFLIILVIAAHDRIPSVAMNIIYLFHMPAFMFISGYLKKDVHKDCVVDYRKLMISRMYPYLMINFLYILMNLGFEIANDLSKRQLAIQIAKRLAAIIYGNHIWENNVDYIGTSWFLPALMLCEVMFYYLKSTEHDSRKSLGIAFLLSFGLCFYQLTVKEYIRMPLAFDCAIISLPILLCGYTARRWRNHSNSFLINLLITLAGIVFGYYNSYRTGYKINLYGMTFGNPLIYFSSAILISYGLLRIIEILYRKGLKCRIVEKIGKESLLIMFFHLPIKKLFTVLEVPVLAENAYIRIIAVTVTSFILARICSRFIPELFNFNQAQKTIAKHINNPGNQDT